MESFNILIIFNCDISSGDDDDDRDSYCNFRVDIYCEIEAGCCDDVYCGTDGG